MSDQAAAEPLQATLLDAGPAGPVHPERLRVMWRAFGRKPPHQCGSCQHLLRYHNGTGTKRWCKCGLTAYWKGFESTDWGARWPACGRWEQRQGNPRSTVSEGDVWSAH